MEFHSITRPIEGRLFGQLVKRCGIGMWGTLVAMPDGGTDVDTAWLQIAAADCDGTSSAVRGHLGSVDNAVDTMKKAAPGWSFLGSLDKMNDRWEKLNKVLRTELDHAADEFRFSADDYDGRENWFARTFHQATSGWDDVLDYD